MSDRARPVPDRTGDQEAQAQHLQPTGNGPTVDDEQALLAAEHGEPDAAGFFTRPDTDESADQDDTAEGGEQA
ncbi:hypothetical protein ACFVTT_15560 [Streptomyces niveus]|uniref:hypothetical protein n=1 Tax=Streptomyces niveus TaxID=193462 RepID=UPI00341920C3